MMLHSMNLMGNLHSATSYINKVGLASYLFSINDVSANGSIAIFRFPDEQTCNYFKEKGVL